ncbi:LysR family transcriptional regulator [Yoonia sp. SS1-5]|uniref:LysR family transcriptional regulator n=1 Tax=Yoonia rhodophyticola TaxID=3137370 RepID=A0AAN0NK26_9RHOB
MQRNQLSDMTIFVEVARANGFRAAANNLKLGAGSVSEAIQRFEDRLGVRLFDRTTRKIALTTAGQKLYDRSLPAIQDLEFALRELNERQETVSGTLKLSAPRSSGPFFLDQLLCEYAARYPDVHVEVIYDDRKVDLVSSGVDAAIRFEHLLEADTHAIAVGPPQQLRVVGSAAYWARKGIPKTPDALVAHDGIYFAFGTADQIIPWKFWGKEGPYSVNPIRRMVVNDVNAMMQFARAGVGAAYVYTQAAEPFLASGELVSVLDGQIPDQPRHTINYLSKRHMPRRLRAFIDLAKRGS